MSLIHEGELLVKNNYIICQLSIACLHGDVIVTSNLRIADQWNPNRQRVKTFNEEIHSLNFRVEFGTIDFIWSKLMDSKCELFFRPTMNGKTSAMQWCNNAIAFLIQPDFFLYLNFSSLCSCFHCHLQCLGEYAIHISWEQLSRLALFTVFTLPSNSCLCAVVHVFKPSQVWHALQN